MEIKNEMRGREKRLQESLSYREVIVSVVEKTYRNVIDSHAAQGPPVITEVILNGRICHLKNNKRLNVLLTLHSNSRVSVYNIYFYSAFMHYTYQK